MSGDSLAGVGVLVTGGGSGIGLACARRFHADGAVVTICGRTEARLVDACQAIGPPSRYVVADVTSLESVRSAAQAAADAAPEGLRIVVANAGGGAPGSVVTTSLEDWNRTVAVNVTGTWLTIREATPLIAAAGGGAVVAVSSIAGILTHRYMSPYAVAKAAVEMLVRNAADELGRASIRVNGVRPGLVPTDASAVLVDTGEARADYLAQMPLGRVGTVEEVAEAVRFLAGPESSWITGQILSVDGGHTLRRGPDVEPLMRSMMGDAWVDAPLRAGLTPQPIGGKI